MDKMQCVDVAQIKLGMIFSAPLFFEDGENMFIPDNKKITQYHLDVIRNWKVPHLHTYGEEVIRAESDEDEELEEL